MLFIVSMTIQIGKKFAMNFLQTIKQNYYGYSGNN